MVFHWAKDQNTNYEGRIVFILTIQFDLKNKESRWDTALQVSKTNRKLT